MIYSGSNSNFQDLLEISRLSNEIKFFLWVCIMDSQLSLMDIVPNVF
jgi:hypothetical protein